MFTSKVKNLIKSNILLFCILIGIALPVYTEVVDELIAVVNGEVITLSMIQDAINAFWNDNQPKSESESLEKLIDHTLSLQEARRLGLEIIVSKEDLSREIAILKARFLYQNEFDEALKRRGITQADLEEYLVEEIMVNEMVNRKFRNFVEVSDLDASEYYQEHKEELLIQEAFYFDQIFFPFELDIDENMKDTLKDNAQRIFEDIKKGADISKYIGKNEGEGYVVMRIGYIPISEVPVPVVASAISQLEVSESRFIETPAGYFIIRLNDRRSARQATFEEAKEEIKRIITHQKTETELKAWLKKQRETADIRIKTVITDHSNQRSVL